MIDLMGSVVKEQILLYLGLRGGISGRKLARVLQKSPTPVFKALRQLEKLGVVVRVGSPKMYTLNRDYPYFDELVSIIEKRVRMTNKLISFIPHIAPDRRVDAVSVYEFLPFRDAGNIKSEKFSDVLRKKYA